MPSNQHQIIVETNGRGTYEITDLINHRLRGSNFESGLVNLFVHHTSASLIVCENADPGVLRDLEVFMKDLVPDGDERFHHRDEGPDDMPAHVRSVLTQCSLSIPVAMSKLALGTWQGVFLWEHRTQPHRRRITLTLMGEYYVA
jgi:secondary thiamine-phosphate synthase enzyme